MTRVQRQSIGLRSDTGKRLLRADCRRIHERPQFFRVSSSGLLSLSCYWRRLRRTPRCFTARRSTRSPTASRGSCSSSRRSSASPFSGWSTSCRKKSREKKKHPQTRAIQCLCLLSLFFGGLLWPIAWLWAYTKPVLHKMAYGTDVDERSATTMAAKAEDERSRKTSRPRRGTRTASHGGKA